MKPSHYRSLCIAAAALVLAACVDRDNPAGSNVQNPKTPPGPGAPPVMVQALTCQANVRTLQVQCDDAIGTSGANRLILGGQNINVTLTSSNVNYVPATGAFTMDVTVRNLIPQPLGTADSMPAMTPEPEGVRVFFHTDPTVTAGSGMIDVLEDGQATYMDALRDYYQYNTVLEQYEVSAPKTWAFTVPSTVETFYFGVYVAAAVPWPTGYVTISGNPAVRSGAERQLTARAYNQFGLEDTVPVTFTWTALDSTRARVDPATGLVHGQRFGSTGVVATVTDGSGRHGTLVMNVSPIRRYWTGAAAVTNWENGANWWPDSIAPQAQDTAVVPDTTASIFPALVQNELVGGLEVLDITPGGVVPTVSLGAFNLEASGSVITTNSSSVESTVGRLFLTGIAQTVEGTLPRVTVTGTYSLSGSVTSDASLRVQSGRLRSQSFRIRVVNP